MFFSSLLAWVIFWIKGITCLCNHISRFLSQFFFPMLQWTIFFHFVTKIVTIIFNDGAIVYCLNIPIFTRHYISYGL
jgi:hypothetical protein